MKISLRLISVALVLAIATVFVAIPVSAATSANYMDFKLTADTSGGFAVGDVITVTLSAKADTNVHCWNLQFFFDKTKLMLLRRTGVLAGTDANAPVWLNSYGNTDKVEDDGSGTDPLFALDADGFGEYYGAGKNDIIFTANIKAVDFPFPAAYPAETYQSCKILVTNPTSLLAKGFNTNGEWEDIVRFRFKVLDASASQFGIYTNSDSPTHLTACYAYPDDLPLPYYAISSTQVKLSTTIAVPAITIGPAAPSGPSVASAAGDIKCRWMGGNTSSKLELGLLGTISGTTITADSEGMAVELTACGVLASSDATLTADTFVDGTEGVLKAPCYTLYDMGDGTYRFRAVMDNVPHSATATVYYRTYITVSGETYYSDIISTTGAAQYARATAAGLAAYTGA